MKKSVIGTIMVAEVALMVSVMALNANTNNANGSAMLAQSENQKKVEVVSRTLTTAREARRARGITRLPFTNNSQRMEK